MQVLLKSRWHNVQEPEKDPQIWQRGFIETGKTDPMADHPLWDELRNVWQRVSDSLGFGQERRAREQRRQNNRRAAEQALNDLWPKLSQEAKRRLAQHHATMIVCADLEEVAQWERYLKGVFGKNVERSSVAGFVRWVITRDGKRLAIVVWNGAPKSAHEHYVYAHEIAHIVDRDTSQDRISNSKEWKNVWESEKSEILRFVYQPELQRSIQENPQEGFASLLALHWTKPVLFQTRNRTIGHFFEEKLLVVPGVREFRA